MSRIRRAHAICFSRPQRAEFRSDVQLPEMGDDGVLVRTEFSTISRGTELDLYTGQMHGRGAQSQWYPMLPGYMPVGIIEAAGKDVTHLCIGDRIVGSNLFTGFDDRYCVAWAGHTEYVVISHASHPSLGARRAVRVPDAVAPDEAGLAMLAGVAWHGVKHKVKPQPGEIILVIGQGVIGNFAAQQCQMLGARVLVTDLHDYRLAVSRANGLQETILNPGKALRDAVLEQTGGEAPQAIIEVTGEMEPFREALSTIRRYGRVHAQGMYLTAAPPDILRTLFEKNLTLSATVGETPEMTAECLAMMADRKITTEKMVTDIVNPRDATDVYDAVHQHPDRYVTCAFKW
jgi:3-hydroxyethyl bacteriochlorophyllide a dehydrogenase